MVVNLASDTHRLLTGGGPYCSGCRLRWLIAGSRESTPGLGYSRIRTPQCQEADCVMDLASRASKRVAKPPRCLPRTGRYRVAAPHSSPGRVWPDQSVRSVISLQSLIYAPKLLHGSVG